MENNVYGVEIFFQFVDKKLADLPFSADPPGEACRCVAVEDAEIGSKYRALRLVLKNVSLVLA